MQKKPQAAQPFASANLTRRNTLGILGASMAAMPLVALARPTRPKPPVTWPPTAGSAREATPAWACGGTAALQPMNCYPDPFTYAVVDAATPVCAMMLGPCHDPLAPKRRDISEGMPGLPTRLGLRIVDPSGQAVPNAAVDIWHCSSQGVYSSETNDTPEYCTDGSEEALAARYFRGYQETDERGIVWFETCLPGWYEGRAVHVHVTVRRDGIDGPEHLTTQLTFANNLINEVCSEHPDYRNKGLPDTPLAADMLFDNEQLAQQSMQAQRMLDGTLQAWKTLPIRVNLSTPNCQIGLTDEEAAAFFEMP